MNRCPLCVSNEESVNHLFMECNYTKRVENILEQVIENETQLKLDKALKYEEIFSAGTNNNTKTVASFLYHNVWRERCNRTFGDRVLSEHGLTLQVIDDIKLFQNPREYMENEE